MQQEQNISLPFSWKQVGYFFLALLLMAISYINFLDLISEWERLGLGSLIKEDISSLSQLAIIKEAFVADLLLIATIISFAKSFKPNLKSYSEEGFLYYLIYASILGLIVGLIAGFIGGLIIGLILGLIAGFIVGLIAGFIVGLILGLVEEKKPVKSSQS